MSKGLKIMVAQMATLFLMFLTISATAMFSSTFLDTDSYVTMFGVSFLFSIGLFVLMSLTLLTVEYIYKHF
nr:MAG TPA: hypothetical protein [Caudoviricetes sp.]